MPGVLLRCPIRGSLTTPERAADGLTFSEEKRRIDCIRFLLERGYPPAHFRIETDLLRFGHRGRNSFRTDLAVLDVPASSLSNNLEIVKSHIRLIAEIKRDNRDAVTAKETQVYPAMDFLQDLSAYGIYWDDIEQRLFYRTLDGMRTHLHETVATFLPKWGQALGARILRHRDLELTNLHELFVRVEDRLHAQITDTSRRFEIMLQLILVKLYDEHIHGTPDDEMDIQDFTDAPLSDTDVKKGFKELLDKAVRYYSRYLPREVSTVLRISGDMLRTISALIAPVKVLGSKRSIVQSFYMYFARGVYKWDLAQYFTPSEVVDFIVALVNPRANDQIKDPACGSGDFLISSIYYAQQHGADICEAIWGAENSEQAAQICVLNMVLNGDGKSNIKPEDSLEKVARDVDSFTVMLCNPPFGVQIQERRSEVLKQFVLGHEWTYSNGDFSPSEERVLRSQEVGLLFAELCVKQAAPGGRIGIILPNGYLGNRSSRYMAFREWLLRVTRVVAVVAFPRFTFKKSGADVSASVVVMEKRARPLARAIDSEDYPFYVGVLESVGWSVSDKGAKPLFKRDPETGVYLTDGNNERISDADFSRVLEELWSSPVAEVFPWVTDGIRVPLGLPRGWSVSIRQVVGRSDRSLDPKRWSERAALVRQQILGLPHFHLEDVVDLVPMSGGSWDTRTVYRYVELQDVADGVVAPTSRRGWDLPDRARHVAHRGDIFVANIWSSINKWFVAGGDCTSMIVSNGFHRLRLKPDKQDFLVDVVAGLNTEGYRIQARSCCTGSDGLAELIGDDLLDIVLPQITNPEARAVMQQQVETLLDGRTTVASVVDALLERGQIACVEVQPRSTHWVQV